MFTTNEEKIAQMMDDPPILADSNGHKLTFIDAEKIFPSQELPNGGIRYRYRWPSAAGEQGAIFEFTFKNPPQKRFSFGFRVNASAR